MKSYLGILLFAIASKARASEGTDNHIHHDDLKVQSHTAYHNVESSCAMDVELLCVPQENPLMSLLSGDPFFDWISISSTVSYPPTSDEAYSIIFFVDQMFDSVLAPCASREPSIFFFQEVESPQLIVEDRGAQFSTENESDEVPQLAHELQNYGASLLQDVETGSEQYQLARRLTEIDTKKIDYHVELPFGSKNYCLRKAVEQEMVSEKCARSIWMLENTFALETDFTRRQEAFMKSLLICMASFAVLISLLLARCVNVRRRNRRRRLNQKVIATVYSNSSIRKQVELEIGESVGYVVRGNSCSFRGNSPEKKTNVQSKNLLPTKTISCKGGPVQIV